MNLSEYHLALQINANASLKIPSGVDGEQVNPTTTGISIKFLGDVIAFYVQFRNALDRKLQNAIDGF